MPAGRSKQFRNLNLEIFSLLETEKLQREFSEDCDPSSSSRSHFLRLEKEKGGGQEKLLCKKGKQGLAKVILKEINQSLSCKQEKLIFLYETTGKKSSKIEDGRYKPSLFIA